MKGKSFFMRSAIFVALFSGSLSAVSAPNNSGYFQYQVGGAAPIMRAPNPAPTHVSLNASADWNSAFSCGAFDPMGAIEASFDPDALEGGFANLQGSIYSALTAAISGLPMLLLQRLHPDWYDYIQKGFAMIQGDIKFAEGTCQQMQGIITGSQGIDYENWVQMSNQRSWRTAMGSGNDILTTKQSLEDPDNIGADGVPWIGGESRGGSGQAAIRPVRDVVAAGYNNLLNRDVDDTDDAAGAALSTPLGGTWGSPAEASEWAVEVLGDKSISLFSGSNKASQPGKGLVTKYEEARDDLVPVIADLVSGATPLTDDALDALSAGTVPISRPMIEALQREPERESVVARLASEIALSQTMDRALYVKRMLVTGKREPNVAAQKQAVAEINSAIKEIDNEIKSLMSEIDLRDRLAARTPMLLLERQNARDKSGALRSTPLPPLRAGAQP